MSKCCRVMHTHRGSWRTLWAWDWCHFSSFNIHNLSDRDGTQIFKKENTDSCIHDVSSLFSTAVPVQEDQCCQVPQQAQEGRGVLQAHQPLGLLSVHHGPGKTCDYATETLSTQGYFLLRYSRVNYKIKAGGHCHPSTDVPEIINMNLHMKTALWHLAPL